MLRVVDPNGQPRAAAATAATGTHEVLYFKDQQWFGKKPKGSIMIGSGDTTIIGETFIKGRGRGKCITIETKGEDRQYRWIPDGDNAPWLELLRNLDGATDGPGKRPLALPAPRCHCSPLRARALSGICTFAG